MKSVRWSAFLAWLLVACRGEPAEMPVVSTGPQSLAEARGREDSTFAVICANLHNSYECAQAIERHVLASETLDVVRRNATLVIPLAGGRLFELNDTTVATPNTWYSYLRYLPEVGYHVVEVQYYEGGAYLLVNARSGKTTLSHGLPVVSPDRSRIAAGNVDLDAAYSPTGVQVWFVELDSLRVEWEHDLTQSTTVIDSMWGPSQVRWASPSELQLVREFASGEERGIQVVRRTRSGWAFAPP